MWLRLLPVWCVRRPASHHRPNKPTSAKFFFICDRDAFVPQISLNFEDYLECEVEVNFVTVASTRANDDIAPLFKMAPKIVI